jgi:hypothetical protein
VTDLPLLKQQEQLTWRRGRRFAKGEPGNRSGRPRGCGDKTPRAAEFLLDGTGKGPAACGRRTTVARILRADLPQIQVRLGAWLNFWLYLVGFCIRLLRRSALMPPGADPPAGHSSGRGQAAFQEDCQAAGEGRRIGQLLALDDAGLVEQQPGEFGQLLGHPGFADRGREAFDQPVASAPETLVNRVESSP